MIEYNLTGPSYRPFPYERDLAMSELAALTGGVATKTSKGATLRTASPVEDSVFRRLAFSSRASIDGREVVTDVHRLEQSGLRARFGEEASNRKESNYLTHGLHHYKGKFYPQLARALVNMAGVQDGAVVLDPFMGSGTTLVESWLAGMTGIGFDISPLAHLVARTKLLALQVGPEKLTKDAEEFEQRLRAWSKELRITWTGRGAREPESDGSVGAGDFARAAGCPEAERELDGWFPPAVQHKLVVVLMAIRAVRDPVGRDFIRVCLSDLVRSFSQQEPRDLRIRRRAVEIRDADVFTDLTEKVWREIAKIRAGAELLGVSRPSPRPECGDIRTINPRRRPSPGPGSVDAVVTSPPYATALPYVDTDRLSFLVLGLATPRSRNALQRDLIGTREIADRERRALEAEMESPVGIATFPVDLATDLRRVLDVNRAFDVGFRRRNTPALLYQYFRDMRAALRNVHAVSKQGSYAFLVLGDSETTLGDGEVFQIRTCEHVAGLCEQVGYERLPSVAITVTTEDRAHAKNAITENQILVLKRR